MHQFKIMLDQNAKQEKSSSDNKNKNEASLNELNNEKNPESPKKKRPNLPQLDIPFPDKNDDNQAEYKE